jgi:hypothetical protein
MPTLIRFLTIVGVLIGVFYGSMYVLANFFEPHERELTKTVRNVKLK